MSRTTDTTFYSPLRDKTTSGCQGACCRDSEPAVHQPLRGARVLGCVHTSNPLPVPVPEPSSAGREVNRCVRVAGEPAATKPTEHTNQPGGILRHTQVVPRIATDLEALRTAHATTVSATESCIDVEQSLLNAEQRKQIRHATTLNIASHRGSHILRSALASLEASGHVQVALVLDRTLGSSARLMELSRCLKRVTAEVQRRCRVSCRFALVVYSNDRTDIAQSSFLTADAMYPILTAVRAVKAQYAADDCFGALLTAATHLEWSAPQRVIVWMGDRGQHRENYTTEYKAPGGSQEVARVMAQQMIRCELLEVKQYNTQRMSDALRVNFAEAGAELTARKTWGMEPTLTSALESSINRTVRHVVVKDKVVRREMVDPTSRLSWWSAWQTARLFTLRPQMEQPAGVHPLSELLMRFPPSHEEEVQLCFKHKPFAEGELCYAYPAALHLPTFFSTWRGTTKKVAKLARYGIPAWSRRYVHVRCVTTFLMREFSERLIQRDEAGTFRRMESVPAQLAKLGAEEFVVEPRVTGGFVRFNNNNGAVMDGTKYLEPQAFSHFTHHYSGGRVMVVSLQGVIEEDRYTCIGAVIHTASRDKILPDSANLGSAGMAAFYKTHQCNDVCRLLGLPDVPQDATELEQFVEQLAGVPRPIAPYLADHKDVEATL